MKSTSSECHKGDHDKYQKPQNSTIILYRTCCKHTHSGSSGCKHTAHSHCRHS